jgi:tRNA modification GTPase
MLCDIDRSLVSPIPGTTRDYVEERFSFGGTVVTLVDTAGLREVADEIESEGIRRSRLQMRGADLLIITIDGSLPLDAGDLQLIDEFRDRSPLVVLSKSDLPAGVDPARLGAVYPALRILPVSTLAGLGCAELLQAVADRCRAGRDGEPTSPNRRHREALRRAAAALEEAGRTLASGTTSLDLAAAELRLALSALGDVTGETTSEEVVDRIFSRFCLGK